MNELNYLTSYGAGAAYYTKLDKRRREIKRRADADKPKDALSILQGFHSKAKNTYKRLGLLREASQTVLRDVTLPELQRKRKQFDKFKDSVFPVNALCWLCNKIPAHDRHHVILLKHGGPELLKDNIVYLCRGCHSIVHPWMNTSLSEHELTRIIELVHGAREGKYTRTQVDIELASILDVVFAYSN